jgi:hypothetical protein
MTPHTFTNLSGAHTFTVPDFDPHGHPFDEWNTHEPSTTIFVGSGGTYTAYYYEEPPVGVVFPGSIDFGTVEVGSSADSTFFITNVGGGLLEGDVTEDCEHYWIVDGEGYFALAAGESLFVTVMFEPMYAGQHDCTIMTGLGLRSDVFCTGFGDDPPACDISPLSLDFGTVLVDDYSERSFTITNVGGGLLVGSVSQPPGDFTVWFGGGSYSLGAGESRTVGVRFEPATPDTHTSTVETGSDLCMDVACYGIARLPVYDVAVINVVPSDTLIEVGDTLDISVTVENQGDLQETYGMVPPNYEGDPIPTAGDWYTIWSMGDISRDGYINIVDVDLFQAAMGSMPGDPNWNPDADLNEDGVIDISDMAILAANQGQDIWTLFGYPIPQAGTQRSVRLSPAGLDTIQFHWDTTNVPVGEYEIAAYATPLPSETDTLDNIFTDGIVTIHSLSDVAEDEGRDQPEHLPKVTRLLQNSPNPFNPVTNIHFDLAEPRPVRLVIYAMSGRKVIDLVGESYPAGRHVVTWDGRDEAGRAVSSGVYFYRLSAGPYTETKRMVLIK